MPDQKELNALRHVVYDDQSKEYMHTYVQAEVFHQGFRGYELRTDYSHDKAGVQVSHSDVSTIFVSHKMLFTGWVHYAGMYFPTMNPCPDIPRFVPWHKVRWWVSAYGGSFFAPKKFGQLYENEGGRRVQPSYIDSSRGICLAAPEHPPVRVGCGCHIKWFVIPPKIYDATSSTSHPDDVKRKEEDELSSPNEADQEESGDSQQESQTTGDEPGEEPGTDPGVPDDVPFDTDDVPHPGTTQIISEDSENDTSEPDESSASEKATEEGSKDPTFEEWCAARGFLTIHLTRDVIEKYLKPWYEQEMKQKQEATSGPSGGKNQGPGKTKGRGNGDPSPSNQSDGYSPVYTTEYEGEHYFSDPNGNPVVDTGRGEPTSGLPSWVTPHR